MPYIANTPESSPSVARSDYRNPQTTCKGITSNGRPCKRGLASSSLNAQRNGQYMSPGEYYCWQHKHQARTVAFPPRAIRSSGSIDTLVERLKLNDGEASDAINIDAKRKPQQSLSSSSKEGRENAKQPSLFARLCCVTFGEDYDDRIEIARRKNRVQTRQKARFHEDSRYYHCAADPCRFDRLIPRTLPMHVKVQLQTEISKPISEFDEDGYIYMYRKIAIPGTESGPCAGLAETRGIGLSDLSQNSTNGPKKILVKIGFTSNVQKRLSTWSGKCRSQIELLRYYPHVSSSYSEQHQPRKTPYCRRVERLVHIELAHKRVKQSCVCGSVHREWFEVDANVEAVRSVDEAIQRWISWAESQGEAKLYETQRTGI